MKRLLALAGLLLGLLMLPLGANAAKPESIRIESWLHRLPVATNPLVSGDVEACAKVWIGNEALVVGGAPAWSDETSYTSAAGFDAKCGDWTDVGGYRFEGKGHLQPQNYGLLDHILFARHEITLEGGSIFIQFVGRYDPTFAGTGNWVITGGTGDFEGLQGTGTWTAQGHVAGTIPDTQVPDLYFMHTEVGTVHWTGH